MSLTVYLTLPPQEEDCWCPHCDHHHKKLVGEEVYQADITHNLSQMADAAGIYEYLWEPKETVANQLIQPLENGLKLLKSDPERFKKFDNPGGWGLYKHLVSFCLNYLDACKRYPNAIIKVWG